MCSRRLSSAGPSGVPFDCRPGGSGIDGIRPIGTVGSLDGEFRCMAEPARDVLAEQRAMGGHVGPGPNVVRAPAAAAVDREPRDRPSIGGDGDLRSAGTKVIGSIPALPTDPNPAPIPPPQVNRSVV